MMRSFIRKMQDKNIGIQNIRTMHKTHEMVKSYFNSVFELNVSAFSPGATGVYIHSSAI